MTWSAREKPKTASRVQSQSSGTGHFCTAPTKTSFQLLVFSITSCSFILVALPLWPNWVLTLTHPATQHQLTVGPPSRGQEG